MSGGLAPWRRRARGLAAAALAALALPAWAQIARLDDSASPRAQVQTDFGRAQPVDAHTVRLALGRVDYRLATAPYVGRRARIFYVVPAQIAGLRSPGALTVQWGAGALLGAGQAQAGMRVPVWTGVVRGPWLQDAIELTLLIDTRALQLPGRMPLSFESYFEIEVLP